MEQFNWCACSRCSGMFFAGNNTPGVCPGSTQGHLPEWHYGQFGLIQNPSYPVLLRSYQDNWRWCQHCQGLFFAGNASWGMCSATKGAHVLIGSGDYYLAQDSAGWPLNGWRWCQKCQGLWLPDPARLANHCPAGR
jgi:hypothetical protein